MNATGLLVDLLTGQINPRVVHHDDQRDAKVDPGRVTVDRCQHSHESQYQTSGNFKKKKRTLKRVFDENKNLKIRS